MDDAAWEGLPWSEPAPGLRALMRPSGPIREIQVYGQRCSGTNVLLKLLAANFGSGLVPQRHGFKHWLVPEQTLFPQDCLVVAVARDACDWLRSLHRQPWHLAPASKALGFSPFIRAEWHSVWDAEFDGIDAGHPLLGQEMLHERDPRTGGRFANPLAKRAAKLRNWSGLAGRANNLALLNHAALRDRPRDLVDAFAALLVRPPAHDYAPVETYKGNGFRRFTPTAYDPLSDEDAAFIDANLDKAAERRFGLG
jgi:hypothetical protein